MTLVWATLSLGAVYAVIAMLFNITIIGASVVNFAIPFVMVFSAFVAVWAREELGLPWWAVILVTAVVGSGICFLEQILAVRFLGVHSHSELVVTVGVSIVLLGVIFALWGAEPRRVTLFEGNDVVTFLGGRSTPADLVMIVSAVVLCLGLALWTNATRYGISSLARAEDIEAAMLRGLNVRRMATLSFVISGAVAGVMGVFLGAKIGADATTAFSLAILGFVAMTIGGQKSYWGALCGGMVVAAFEYLGALWLSVDLAQIAVLVLFAGFLVLRPHGIFGRSIERRI